jgi:hypothetical protein
VVGVHLDGSVHLEGRRRAGAYLEGRRAPRG